MKFNLLAVFASASLLVDLSFAAELEEVVTIASRADQLISKVPASVVVIEDDLNSINHEHVSQALNQLAGVNLQHGSGQEYLPAIRSPVLTGAGACGAFLISENSVPLRAAGFCNLNELFESHTEQAERIEVLRGPGTALHGSNAMHGVVNVITVPDEYTQASSIGLDHGSYGYWRSKLTLTDGENVGFKLSATHDGGWRSESGYDQQKLTAYFKQELSNLEIKSGISISHLEQETAGFIVGLDAFEDVEIARRNFDPEAYRNVDSLRLWSEVSPNQGEAWKIIPYLRLTDMEFLQHFLPGKPLEENGQKSLGVLSQFYVTPALTLGLDAELTRGFLKQAQGAPTTGSSFLQETVPSGRHYDFEVDALMLAVFAQYSNDISERLTLIAGLRAELMDYDYDNRMINGRTREDGSVCGFGGCRYSRPADSSDSFSNISPKLGLLFEIDKRHRMFANVSSGYRAPQANELYRLQRGQSIADLDSESLVNIELGLRGVTDGFQYQFSIYNMQKKNVIFRDSDFFNVSNGKTSHAGIELEGSWAISETIALDISTTYAEHEYENNTFLNGVDIAGNHVDTAPQLNTFFRLGWHPVSTIKISLEWLHLDNYFLEPENLHQYPGHDLLNLRTHWQIGDGWSAYFNLENLADERYADRADFTGFTGERYFPGKPVNYQLGIQKRW